MDQDVHDADQRGHFGWRQKTGEEDFYRAKLSTAAYFMDKVLPQTGALFSSIMAGGATMIDFPEAAF